MNQIHQHLLLILAYAQAAAVNTSQLLDKYFSRPHMATDQEIAELSTICWIMTSKLEMAARECDTATKALAEMREKRALTGRSGAGPDKSGAGPKI